MYIYGRIKRFTETVKSVLLNIDIGTWALCATTDTGSYDLIALHYPEDSESEGCFIRVVADELGYDTVFDDAKIYNESDSLETVLRAFALDINNYEYDEKFKERAVETKFGMQDPLTDKMVDSVLGKDGTFDKYVDNKRKEQLERGDIIMADTLGKAAEERSTRYEEYHKKDDDEESVES